jgi:hypothetical protein
MRALDRNVVVYHYYLPLEAVVGATQSKVKNPR